MPLVLEETDTWRPIPHDELIEALREQCRIIRKPFVQEDFTTYAHGDTLYGFVDLRWRLDNGCSISFGVRHANNKRVAFQLVAGVRPGPGRAMVFHGETVSFKRRHTQHFNLGVELRQVFDGMLAHAGRLENTTNELRYRDLTGATLHRVFYQVFTQRILPVPMYHTAVAAVDSCVRQDGHNLWALCNAFAQTAATMAARPRYTAMLRLGELFTRWD